MENLNKPGRAIIIGAGPAGLTAAYELLKCTEVKPVILEMSGETGGISKTVDYKGNRIDIGMHGYFPKSERVMNWWRSVLPIQGKPSLDEITLKLDTAGKYAETAEGPDPQSEDKVMLIRRRISRIFFLREFFDCPITFSTGPLLKLGPMRVAKILASYLWSQIFPLKPERSLEDYFINRFGRELYATFFKDIAEKLWGVPCCRIKSEWGAQSDANISIIKMILHALKKALPHGPSDVVQKRTETLLIEQFWYPKFGTGQLWQTVAEYIVNNGGEIIYNAKVTGMHHEGGKIRSVVTQTPEGPKRFTGDHFLSTMPICDLIDGITPAAPNNVREVALGLKYRSYVTVGLLLKELKLQNKTTIRTVNNIVPDNWIDIPERDVKAGRLVVFNNQSPYMVKNPANAWVGLEYFCDEDDQLWSMPDDKFIRFAAAELEKIGFIDQTDILDACIIRVPKAYPAYSGTYDRLGEVREYVNEFDNLFLMGRNGRHRYNSMDDSTLSAMSTVDAIAAGSTRKDAI